MNQIWYLSPSRQTENVGINGYGMECTQMYLLTDAITPHLDRCGVSFYVADQAKTLVQRTAEANTMDAKFYLALHSNAGGNGKAYGPIAFYYSAGKALAEELIRNLLVLGQMNNRYANVQKNTSLYELCRPVASACLLEVDFHDSEEGVAFMTSRRADIAAAIAKAIVAIYGKQWVPPFDHKTQAVSLGLVEADASGSYRWQDAMTREEGAAALIRLREHLKKGVTP